MRIYALRDWIVIAAAAGLSFWAYHTAAALEAVHDPPPPRALGIAMGWREFSRLPEDALRQRAFQIDAFARVEVDHCKNPVEVIADFHPTAAIPLLPEGPS